MVALAKALASFVVVEPRYALVGQVKGQRESRLIMRVYEDADAISAF